MTLIRGDIMASVLAIIFDGFEELEATAPFALLRRAGAELVISSDKPTVVGGHHIAYTNIADLNRIDYTKFDCLLIPGGPHYKRLYVDTYVHNIIKYFMQANKLIATICAGPTLLGRLGYLKDTNYTCFTSMNADFGGTYHDTGVVYDKNIISARSAAYSIDFAYKIIEVLMGENTLKEVQKHIYYEK